MVKCMLALLFVFHAASAIAEDQRKNWYLLGGAGLSNTKAAQDQSTNDAGLAAQGFGVLASREDSGAASLWLGAGYQFSRRLALEVSFLDFGQLHYYSATYTTGPNFGALSKQWNASGVETTIVGAWPLTESVLIVGKAGVLSVKGKYRTTTTVTQPNGVIVARSENSASGSDTAPGFGLGIMYSFDQKMSVRAVYDGWRTEAGTFGRGDDLNRIQQFSLSLLYRL